jgi:hypothetical protein
MPRSLSLSLPNVSGSVLLHGVPLILSRRVVLYG